MDEWSEAAPALRQALRAPHDAWRDRLLVVPVPDPADRAMLLDRLEAAAAGLQPTVPILRARLDPAGDDGPPIACCVEAVNAWCRRHDLPKPAWRERRKWAKAEAVRRLTLSRAIGHGAALPEGEPRPGYDSPGALAFAMDLHDWLPRRPGRACRVVVLLDAGGVPVAADSWLANEAEIWIHDIDGFLVALTADAPVRPREPAPPANFQEDDKVLAARGAMASCDREADPRGWARATEQLAKRLVSFEDMEAKREAKECFTALAACPSILGAHSYAEVQEQLAYLTLDAEHYAEGVNHLAAAALAHRALNNTLRWQMATRSLARRLIHGHGPGQQERLRGAVELTEDLLRRCDSESDEPERIQTRRSLASLLLRLTDDRRVQVAAAIEWLSEACRLAQELGEPEFLGETLTQTAEAWLEVYGSDRPRALDHAVEYLCEALEQAAECSPTAALNAALLLAGALQQRTGARLADDRRWAVDCCREAVTQHAPVLDSEQQALATAALGQALLGAETDRSPAVEREALATTETALRLAGEDGVAPDSRHRVAIARAEVLATVDGRGRRRRRCEALALLEVVLREAPEGETRRQARLALARVYRDLPSPEAVADCDAVLAAVADVQGDDEAVPAPEWHIECGCLRAEALARHPAGCGPSQAAEAIATAEAALAAAEANGLHLLRGQAWRALGVAHAACRDGDLEAHRRTALACFDSAAAVLRRSGLPLSWAEVMLCRGDACCGPAPDADEALAAYGSARDEFDRHGLAGRGARARVGLARAHLLADEPARAMAELDAALRVATSGELPLLHATAQRLRASMGTGTIDSRPVP